MRQLLRSSEGGGRWGRVVAVVSAFLITPALLDGSSVAASERVGTVAVVALPSGTTTGFAPNILAVSEGGSLNLVGADLQVHNIACVKLNRKTKRPLCQSAFAAAGEMKPVEGVEKLPVGTFSLICQSHPQMKVELRVVGP